MGEKEPNRVIFPFGEGKYALPEDELDRFFMEVSSIYEQLVRTLGLVHKHEPAELPDPHRNEQHPD